MVFGRRTKSPAETEQPQVFASSSNELGQIDENDDDDETNLGDDDDNNNCSNKVEQAPGPRLSVAKSFRSFRTPTASSSSSSQQQPSSTFLKQSAPTQPPLQEYEFGILERLMHAVSVKSSEDHPNFRSPDLIPLMKNFEVFRKKLRQMISVAKKYHKSLQSLDYDRIQMVKELASFADDSPIEPYIGNNSSTDSLSFLSVMYQASNVSAKSAIRYQKEFIQYCVEWENIVSTRVDTAFAAMKQLREMYQHYQDKVDKLRKNVNGQESKGKVVNPALSEKLQRNEEKLVEASELYEASVVPLCMLLIEIVQYGYKDLIPLIVSYMKYEMDRNQQETRTFHLFHHELFEQLNIHADEGEADNTQIKTPTKASRSSSSSSEKATSQMTRKGPLSKGASRGTAVSSSSSSKTMNGSSGELKGKRSVRNSNNAMQKRNQDENDSYEASESSTAYDDANVKENGKIQAV